MNIHELADLEATEAGISDASDRAAFRLGFLRGHRYTAFIWRIITALVFAIGFTAGPYLR